MLSATTWFVTRHKGAVEWAARLGFRAEHVSHLDVASVRSGDTVIGTLPIQMVAQINQAGARYLHLVLDLSAEDRNRELGPDEMEARGARLEEYSAMKVG